MKFNDTLLEVVKLDLETNQVPALMGEPGIGKSSFVKDLAKSMDTQVFVVACNLLAAKEDLTGARLVPYTKPDGTESRRYEFYPHGTIQDAIDYAIAHDREWPILFLDEINRTTSDVTSGVLGISTDRCIGREKLPKNLRIMVAGNDKGNVTTLDDASLSRFSIYRVEPEASTLIAILDKDGTLNPFVKSVLVKQPHLVFQKAKPTVFAVEGGTDDDDTQTAAFADLLDAGEEMRQLTTPRTIHGVSRWLNTASPAKLQEWLQTPVTIGDRPATMLNEILEAHIGDTDFTTFLVAEIADGLAQGVSTNMAATLAAPKPNCFDSLKTATSMTDLEQMVSQLNDHERSGSLLYALYERSDNAPIVKALAAQTTTLEADHNRLLVQLASQSRLDTGNVDILLATTGPAVDGIRMLMSAFN